MYYYAQFIYLERPYAHRQNNHHGCIIVDIREGIPPATRQEDVHSPLDLWWGNMHSWNLIRALWSPDPAERPSAAAVLMHLATPNYGADNSDAAGEAPRPVYYPSQGDQGAPVDPIPRAEDDSDVSMELRMPGTRYPSSIPAHLSPSDQLESLQPKLLGSRTHERPGLPPVEGSSDPRRGGTAAMRSISRYSHLYAHYASFDTGSSGVEFPSRELGVHSLVEVVQSGPSIPFSVSRP
jgi:hypothetical protein